MSATPALPEQGLIRAHGALTGAKPGSEHASEVAEEFRVEDAIIDVPDDLQDPERSTVVHSEVETLSEHLASASEFDLMEQSIVIPEDEDEHLTS